ncbi:hypothetical protein QBC37DRAFT_447520 [Rhypophila decipiens]|uniref:Uncharacterized protein n=1 Tax=Rhypophila decipiens TaxID=261697 RepID=A0AAN7B5B4_9PEZI|nr:hypothetical protein QBC37DRAFT_447520 [Rhypophila decipiens]
MVGRRVGPSVRKTSFDTAYQGRRSRMCGVPPGHRHRPVLATQRATCIRCKKISTKEVWTNQENYYNCPDNLSLPSEANGPISAPITPQNPAKLNSRTGKVTRPRPQTSPASIIDLCGGNPERVGVVKIVGLSSGDPGGWRCRIWGVRAPRLVSALADWAEAQQVTCFQVPARKRRGRNLLRAILRPFQPVRAVVPMGCSNPGTGTERMRMYEYQTNCNKNKEQILWRWLRPGPGAEVRVHVRGRCQGGERGEHEHTEIEIRARTSSKLAGHSSVRAR